MKTFKLLFIMLLAAVTLTAQPPQAMKYKAIAKDEWGAALPNKDISLRFTIYQGSEYGTPVYIETHLTTTDKAGLMDVNIGQGTASLGTFSSIDWSADNYYIQIELDTKGGSDFNLESESSQLLSVPYAFYAGGVLNSDDNDANPGNELITSAILNGTLLEIIEGGILTIIDLSGLQDGVEDADADPYNELQDLSLSGTSLSITEGSTVDLSTLPDEVEDADADPENEIQDLQLVDNMLTITKNGMATEIDLSIYLDDTDTHLTEAEVDAMVDNNGYLTSVSWADIPDVPADLADGDDNTQLSEVEVDAMVENNGYLTSEVDGDVTNEIQDISLSGTELSLTDGSTVDLSVIQDGYEPDTDDQTLSVIDHELTISEGNTITLPDEVDDGDADPENELITEVVLNGLSLEITDAGGTNAVDLSSISGGGGSQTLSSVLTLGNDAGGNNITNLADPVNAQDAATKAYVDALETILFNIIDPATLIAEGVSITDLLSAGVSVADFLTAGVSVADLLAEGISVANMVEAGASVVDLLAAGVSLTDLINAGVNPNELLAAGSTVSDLLDIGISGSDLIGLSYEGGLIFYIDETDGSGMVASPTETITTSDFEGPPPFDDWMDYDEHIWQCYPTCYGTSTSFGSGYDNTELIASQCTDLNGLLVKIYGFNTPELKNYFFGKPDWYVPSIDELNLIRTNLYLQGFGEYSSGGKYATSSEYETPPYGCDNIWCRVFGQEEDDPYFITDCGKTEYLLVILVRDFYE